MNTIRYDEFHVVSEVQMAKVPVALRLTPETLGKVDAHAKSRGVSRQVILESATLSWLSDAEGGVPDLVDGDPPLSREQQEANKAALKAARERVLTQADYNMERQAKLNAAKYRSTR